MYNFIEKDFEYIFVYGILRKNFKNHHFLEKSEFIGEFITLEKLYMITYEKMHFPYVLEDLELDIPKVNIIGEIYRVNKEILRKIDNLEIHPEIYKRKKYKFVNPNNNEIYEAWIYILVKPAIIDYIKDNIGINYFNISSGDWSEYLYSGK